MYPPEGGPVTKEQVELQTQALGEFVDFVDTASTFTGVAGVVKSAIKQGVKSLGKALRGSCCFVAGTQVLTEDGYKNIEDVKIGEKLWAKNTETGEQDWKPVTKIFVVPGRGIYEIKLLGEDGFEQKIQATDDHPFYVVGAGWKDTIELKVGDLIETDGHGLMEVVSVIDEQRVDVTYNFTVADFHTYYVTEKNVLVHNCNLEMKDVGKLSERTKGVFNDVKKNISDIANSLDKTAIACAICKVKQSIKSRKADQKRKVNKNTQSYQDHANRIKMEEEGLRKLERNKESL